MLALHAAWSPGRGLCLWAEDPARAAGPASRSRARGARPHPFAADHGQLGAVAAALGASGAEGQAVLHLPSTGGPTAAGRLPVPSPALDAGRRRSAGSPRGRSPSSSSTPARCCAPNRCRGRARSSRCCAPSRRSPPTSSPAGRVLPAPDPEHDEHALGWRPVLQGRDLVAADAFAAALPPAVRAEALDGRPLAEGAGPDPADVVTDALAAFVDAEARSRLAGEESPPGSMTAAATGTLDEGLARWDVVGAPHAGPARGTFRLTEVVIDDLGHAVEGEPRFWLEFSLQSAQDPSLRVTAESIWRDAGALRRWLDDPQRAAARRARPRRADLPGAHRRPAGAAPRRPRARPGGHPPLPAPRRGRARPGGLRGAAAQLVVRARPARPHRERPRRDGTRRRRREARPAAPRGARRVRAGGSRSTARRSPTRRCAALVDAKAPLVQLRGRWVALDPERLRPAWSSSTGRPPTATVGDVIALRTSYHDDLPPEWARPAAGRGGVRRGPAGRPARRGGRVAPRAPRRPAGLRGHAAALPAPRRLVARVPRAGSGSAGCLADDMGLGKTVQLLALEAHERRPDDEAGPRLAPTLLVVPTSRRRELAAGGGAVRPRAAGGGAPRRRAGEGRPERPAGRTPTSS